MFLKYKDLKEEEESRKQKEREEKERVLSKKK